MTFKFKRHILFPIALLAATFTLSSCIVEEEDIYDTYVRFTWATQAQAHILFIAASDNDVDKWLYKAYCDPAYSAYCDPYSAIKTDSPRNQIGSRDIPDNLFLQDSGGVVNKGRYFSVEPKKYVAVCGIEYDGNYIDIVANYEIKPTTPERRKRYFEVAFDVEAVIGGGNYGVGWLSENYENDRRNAPERLKTGNSD